MTTTALSNLVNVRYYGPYDVYNYATDNRPLTDLQTNIVSLANLIDGISEGNVFYIEDTSSTANLLVATTTLLPSGGPYTPGQLITVRVNTSNTGAVTLSINSGSAYPIQGMAGALQGGELVAGKHYLLSWENSGGVWELIGSGRGNLQVPAAVQSLQALNLGQAQASFAGINGDAAVPFEVADAATSSEAVNLGQVATVAMLTNKQSIVCANSTTYTITSSFTAPCKGFILAASTINVTSTSCYPPGSTNYIYINGVLSGAGSYAALDEGYAGVTNWGNAAVSAGQACTITSSLVTSSQSFTINGTASQTVVSIFIPNP